MGARKPPYGQHFLHDRNLLEAIVRDAELPPGTPVLEIGCGEGALTDPLLAAGARVTGVELDKRLLPGLAARFGSDPAFRLVPGDILELDWDGLLLPGRATVAMGNLPYSVSTEVFFRVLAHRARVVRAVFLVQYEVARRVCAAPGNKDYGILSIACQLFGVPRLVRKVPPSVFTPPPNVDSAVFRWDLSPDCLFPARDPAFTLRAVKAAFGHRRKTLANGLAGLLLPGGALLAKERALALLTALGHLATVRAEQLSVAQWVDLSNRILDEDGDGGGPA
jgi:16S rRNA (adenine1518-N6/adenine1519-N6)-dimethyltransferase